MPTVQLSSQKGTSSKALDFVEAYKIINMNPKMPLEEYTRQHLVTRIEEAFRAGDCGTVLWTTRSAKLDANSIERLKPMAVGLASKMMEAPANSANWDHVKQTILLFHLTDNDTKQLRTAFLSKWAEMLLMAPNVTKELADSLHVDPKPIKDKIVSLMPAALNKGPKAIQDIAYYSTTFGLTSRETAPFRPEVIKAMRLIIERQLACQPDVDANKAIMAILHGFHIEGAEAVPILPLIRQYCDYLLKSRCFDDCKRVSDSFFSPDEQKGIMYNIILGKLGMPAEHNYDLRVNEAPGIMEYAKKNGVPGQELKKISLEFTAAMLSLRIRDYPLREAMDALGLSLAEVRPKLMAQITADIREGNIGYAAALASLDVDYNVHKIVGSYIRAEDLIPLKPLIMPHLQRWLQSGEEDAHKTAYAAANMLNLSREDTAVLRPLVLTCIENAIKQGDEYTPGNLASGFMITEQELVSVVQKVNADSAPVRPRT
jgi:hypothetical protein